jgi:hypothetical protein
LRAEVSGGETGTLLAPSVGVEVSPVNVNDRNEIERAVTAFARSANSGLIVTGSALTVMHRDLIIRSLDGCVAV